MAHAVTGAGKLASPHETRRCFLGEPAHITCPFSHFLVLTRTEQPEPVTCVVAWTFVALTASTKSAEVPRASSAGRGEDKWRGLRPRVAPGH